MLDIKFVRENVELVKENIRKKFQDHKLVLVDEAVEIDKEIRSIKASVEALRARRNSASSEIGALMRNKDIEAANKIKAEVSQINIDIAAFDEKLVELEAKLKKNIQKK